MSVTVRDKVDAGPNAVMLDALVGSAIRAGLAILRIYEQGCAVETKADNSPVTIADQQAEAIILADLARIAPDVPVIAEEEVAAGRIPAHGARFFLVDPLDGTREFIERRGDFTVNIALIEDGVPVLGIVHAPARGTIYVGDVAQNVAWAAQVDGQAIGDRRAIRIRSAPAAGLTVVGSLAHNTADTDAYLAQFKVAERRSYGSSVKLCAVAAGEADLYPRLGPTYEWDIAAGDAVLRAAGGMVYAPDGRPITYAKPRFYNGGGFVAAGDVSPPPIDG